MLSVKSENIRIIEALNGRPVMITVGMFDGVHRGHRYFIRKMVEEAGKKKMIPVLISMYPHPRKIIAKKEFKCLTSLPEKESHIRSLGIEHFIVLQTTRELLDKTASEFLTYLLENKLNIKAVAMGFNNRFGKKTSNEMPVDTIVEKMGMDFIRIPGFGEEVSSTTIREFLVRGEVESAAGLLDYPYALFGHVVEGNKLGRSLGFPTANIKVDSVDKLIPAVGVYAVTCTINNMVYAGMMNIGYRPTVEENGSDIYLEVHMPGERFDIYNQYVKVEFFKKIRDEKRFDSLEELKAQLSKDKDFIITYFHANFVAPKK
ncbi:MAG: riboflavin biosynthesis protein RibF [Bacteroidota bacterium]